MMGTEADVATPATDEVSRLAALRARLAAPMPDDRPWGWLGPLLVTAFGAWLRFDRLQVPRALIFDETYYAKDAWSILQHGVEWNYVSSPTNTNLANQLILQGHTTGLFASCSGANCGEYVVQPEVGKELIAIGEWLFGLNSLGWRFSSAVFGSLAILLMCRIARRMTRSTLLGCIAGLLMSLDGLEFVLSRTGILDIFLMFFVLAAFGCLVIDRDNSRARLAEGVARGAGGDAGPRLGLRKWQVACGILLGLAVGTKWIAAWYIVGFAALFIAWEIGARRAAGLRSFVRGAFREAVWLPLTFIVIPLAVYVATWSNWLFTSTGYDRNYGQLHGVTTPVISALYSLYEYHLQAIGFGLGLSTRHPYQSQPWDWLLITRPVAFYYESYRGPVAGPAVLLPVHRVHRPVVVAGGPGHRDPADLVEFDAGPAVLPGLVAAAPGLAGRCGAAGRAGGLGALVPAGDPDQVLLLRAGVRAVPDPVDRAVPGADPRAGHGQRAAPLDRRRGGRRVRPGRPDHVLVLLPDPGGQGHPVPGLAQPHVVPDRTRLDLRLSAGSQLPLSLLLNSRVHNG